jgi:hypothetical protein
MENTAFTILDAIERVHANSKNSKLELKRFEKVSLELELIVNYFQINTIQSIIVSNFISLSCFEDIDMGKIVKFLGLEKITFLKYNAEIEQLLNRAIIQRSVDRRLINTEYKIKSHFLHFIVNNLPIPTEFIEQKPKEKSFYEFLHDMDKLRQQKCDDEIDYGFFRFNLDILIENNLNYKLVRFAYEQLTTIDLFVFFDVIFDGISRGQNNFQSGLVSTVSDFANKKRESFIYINNFLEGKTKLNQLDLIEKDADSFGNRHNIQLTSKALTMLEEMEGIRLSSVQVKNENLLQPNKLKKINLLYNPEEHKQLEVLSKSLQQNAFKTLQKKLNAYNMPVGLTTLLYGVPGTGKTETVFQLAKKHNRTIFKVDISETKSMWFGESQKLIKEVFTTYNKIKKTEKNCPILLLNEADAIIGKRKAAGSSSVSDTENAIQNIFLEELENFEGILFATTNLVENLDSAFERRFLYKIRFESPSTNNAAKIWKMKLPVLKTKEAEQLAQKYSFSGGEIQNIARKCVVEELVKNSKIDFSTIQFFCDNEKWSASKQGAKIGY